MFEEITLIVLNIIFSVSFLPLLLFRFLSDQRRKAKITPTRLLLIQHDRLGDFVLTTPLLKRVKIFFPQCRVTVWARKFASELLEGQGLADEVWCDDIGVNQFPSFRDIKMLFKRIRVIRRTKFDAVIDVSRDKALFFALASFLSGADIRIGLKTEEKLGFWTVKGLWPFLNHLETVDDETSVADLFLRTLTPFSPERRHLKALSLGPISIAGKDKIEALLKSLFQGEVPGRLISIHVGANDPLKIWPRHCIEHLSSELLKIPDVGIVLTGSNHEESEIDRILENCSSTRIVPFVDRSLSLLSALYKKSDLVIGGDTGPIHVAEAVGSRTVVLFGAINPKHTAPLTNTITILSRHKCSPCYQFIKHRQTQSPGCKRDCMATIPFDGVLQAVKESLGSTG